MKIETKYNNGDRVWMLKVRSMEVVEREIVGLSIQVLGNKTKVMYSFIKDSNSMTTVDPHFWIPEHACFETKEDLIKSLNR